MSCLVTPRGVGVSSRKERREIGISSPKNDRHFSAFGAKCREIVFADGQRVESLHRLPYLRVFPIACLALSYRTLCLSEIESSFHNNTGAVVWGLLRDDLARGFEPRYPYVNITFYPSGVDNITTSLVLTSQQ